MLFGHKKKDILKRHMQFIFYFKNVPSETVT